jgi:hypothetical protein
MNEEFKWTDESVIDFVNWYLKVKNLGVNYELENQTIVDSFKNGDDPSVWNTPPVIKRPKKIHKEDFEVQDVLALDDWVTISSGITEFGFSKSYGIIPKVGDIATLYTIDVSVILGVDINGKNVFMRNELLQ